ncbi:MAG: zinc ribbon domain-containing protein [Clostridia bacterium]|nr:zinc ribbon domain-containing protein [Clostridia bacterium]
MKKYLTLTISIILILISAISVSAENKTCEVKDLNLNITVPSHYNVLTQDIEEDALELKKFGYTKEELVELLKDGNIYFDAFPDNSDVEFVITATPIKLSNIAIFDDDELEELAKGNIGSFEDEGTEIIDYEIYVNSKTTYIAIHFFSPESGYAINYYTIKNYQAINITCWTYEEAVTEKDRELFKTVIDSITYGAYNINDTETTPQVSEAATEYLKEYTVSDEGIEAIAVSVIISVVSFVLTLIAGGIAAIIIVRKIKKRRRLAAQKSAKATVKFCIHCGTQLSSTDSFCYKCGKSQTTDEENINSENIN